MMRFMSGPTPVDPESQPWRCEARPELTGGRRIGVVLSHGFTGTPASIRPWGRHLGELGYAVRVPLLPGHGTRWQDLNRCRFEDWAGALLGEVDDLAGEVDALVVGGLSMGGSLSLHVASRRDVAGVVVVNPALATGRFDVKLLPVLKHVVPAFPGIANDIAKPGVSEYGYTRTPLKAIHSFMQAWPGITAALPQVTAPLLYFRSPQDHVVDGLTEPIVLGGVGSTDVTRIELPDSFHVATLDHDAPRIFAETAAFVARVTAPAAPGPDA